VSCQAAMTAESIHDSCVDGDLKGVVYWLSQGQDVNYADAAGNRPIHLAGACAAFMYPLMNDYTLLDSRVVVLILGVWWCSAVWECAARAVARGQWSQRQRGG
jgi:hypothetical protein